MIVLILTLHADLRYLYIHSTDLLSLVSSSMHPFLCSPLYAFHFLCSPLSMQQIHPLCLPFSMLPFLYANPPSMPSIFYALLSLCKPTLYASPFSMLPFLCFPFSMHPLLHCLLAHLPPSSLCAGALYANSPLCKLPPMQTPPYANPPLYASLSPLCFSFSMLPSSLFSLMQTHPLCELTPMQTHPLCKPTPYANSPPMQTHPLCKLTPYANSPHMQTHPPMPPTLPFSFACSHLYCLLTSISHLSLSMLISVMPGAHK